MKTNEEIEFGALYSFLGKTVKPTHFEGAKIWYHVAGWPSATYVTIEEFRMAAKKIPSDAEKLAIARKGLAAVRALISESQGVAGLHLNGDLAPWSELEQGGRFEAWLIDFNEAEDVLKD